MKKIFFTLIIGGIILPYNSFAAFPVYDATNNLLATLQKTMDSAFQTVQKSNMATMIKQAQKDYIEQIKMYEEAVKQYNEMIKIYEQAVDTYNWIDRNIGDARNLRTFLSSGFSDVNNLQQLFLRLNTILQQTATSTNKDYNQTLLQRARILINSDVLKDRADYGIKIQNYAQASEGIADTSDEISKNMLTKLRTKDQVLESKVSSGSADMIQLLHANEQVSIFIAEELARMNANLSSVNRTVSKNLEIQGAKELNKAQEAATYDLLENEVIQRGTNYTNQRNSWDRINNVFDNCRVF